MKRSTLTITVVASLLSVLILSCTENPVEAEQSSISSGLDVRGFSASYDPSTEIVKVNWEKPDKNVLLYRLYRTNEVDAYGEPEGAVSIGERSRIPGDVTQYEDIVGLANGVYHYAMKAAVFDPYDTVCVTCVHATDTFPDTLTADEVDWSKCERSGDTLRFNGEKETIVGVIQGDTVEGPFSQWDTVLVGTGIGFSINRGDLFLTIDTCDLVLLDRYEVIDSVYFTDSIKDDKPVFDADNPRNQSTAYAVTKQENVYRWALPKRAGTKVVYARVVQRDGDSRKTQQLDDDIQIRPYRVQFKMRNERKPPQWTMKQWPAPRDYVYNIFRPWIRFSISTLSDTTFEREFEYWLVFKEDEATFDVTPVLEPDKKNRILETAPRSAKLTGYGADHDDQYEYTYLIDSDSAEGPQNLDTIRRTIKRPARGGDGGEYSIPGSFWGERTEEKSDGSLDTIWEIASDSAGNPNTVQENLKLLTELDAQDLFRSGKKEFGIIARFRGRYFNELRTVVSMRSFTPGGIETYFDFYPPGIRRDKFQYFMVGDGKTVKGTFSISINEAGYFNDKNNFRGYALDAGGAGLVGAELIIAQMPDSVVTIWDRVTTPSTITRDVLTSWRHRIFPFVFATPQYEKVNLYWYDIDPSEWPSGWYALGIVTEDEFGNKGIAPFRLGGWGDVNANPQHWKIITGR